MSWLALHLRARRVPGAVALAAGGVAVVAVVLARYTSGVSVLLPALALAPVIPTLAAGDAALEKSVAMPWPPRRALHLAACAGLVVALMAGARRLGADLGPLGVIARNSAGLAGLVGLGAAAFGVSWAWQVPTIWSALQTLLPLSGGPVWRQLICWLVQPPGSRVALVVAVVLFLTGTLAYGARVGPLVAGGEAAGD